MASTEKLWNGMKRREDNLLEARIRRLVFSATIYFLWQERNGRIFKQSAKDWRLILKKIERFCVKLLGIG